jgi:hypothetical protein
MGGHYSTIGRMGLEVVVTAPPDLRVALDRAGRAGLACTVAMIDGQLCLPTANIPERWRELRLRTEAGMITLERRIAGVAVVVMSNADERLKEAQRRLAKALSTGIVSG